MAESYGTLGFVNPLDTTENLLYQSPDPSSVITTSIHVVNRATTPKTFRIRVQGGISTWIYYDAPIAAESFVVLDPGITLGNADSVFVTGDYEMMFSIYGVELP
jgi:hypothetical protein